VAGAWYVVSDETTATGSGGSMCSPQPRMPAKAMPASAVPVATIPTVFFVGLLRVISVNNPH